MFHLKAANSIRQWIRKSFQPLLVGALDSMLLQAWLDPNFDIKAASRVFINVMVQDLRPTIQRQGALAH